MVRQKLLIEIPISFRLLFAIVTIVAVVCQGNLSAQVGDQPWAKELREMLVKDQQHRQQLQEMVGKPIAPGSKEAEQLEKLSHLQAENDAENLKRLEEIVKQHGWPGLKTVGQEAATAAFLIIQHAEIEIQDRYLPILRLAQKEGEVRSTDLALLEDRVLMRHGMPQLYGTQLTSKDGKGLQLHSILDEPYVDLRRKQVGLPPLEEYVKLFGLQYQPSNDLFQPMWNGPTVIGESSVLLQDTADSEYIARTALPVAKLIAIRLADRSMEIELKQVSIDSDGYTLKFPRSLNLPGLRPEQLYPTANSPNSYKHRKGYPEQWMLYGPGKYFHQHQIEISYEPKKIEWQHKPTGYSPKNLPRITQKIKDKQPLAIGISGDSISTGLDASKSSDTYPFQAGYVDLVGEKLGRLTLNKVDITNRAIAGWSVANGVQDLDKLLESKPELVIIAYGMNDVGRKNPTWFGEQVDLMLDRIARHDPKVEVILVASMVGNGEWVHTPREMFEPYRNELQKRVRTGVALADLTSIWLELLQHKHDLDLTGNGLNHPNDFGHRLYAQAILSLIVE